MSTYLSLDELIKVGQDVFVSKIPISGTGYFTMQTCLSVREKFFLEKTVLFLKCFEEIDEGFRHKLYKYISQEQYKTNLEDKLIIALERFDESEKAVILFKFFVAHVNKEIEYQEFLRYLYVIDKVDFHSLEIFKQFYSSNQEITNDSRLNSFAFLGLLKLTPKSDIMAFGKNDFGSKFLKILDLVT